MRKLLLVLLALTMATPAAATDPSHVGVGFYFGSICPTGTCAQPNGQPFPPVVSPPLYVSIPYGNGQYGYCTLAGGWAENGDADSYPGNCNSPQNWMVQAYGTVTYDDGEIAYSGPAKFSVEYADTSEVALPYGAICCWQCSYSCGSWPPLMFQPKKYFIRKLKVQSCLQNHTLTNRFIAKGCDGYTVSTFNGEPYCQYMNTNYINLTVSGF